MSNGNKISLVPEFPKYVITNNWEFNKYQSSVFLDLVIKQKQVIGFPGFSYDSQQLFAILLIVISTISTNVKTAPKSTNKLQSKQT